MRIANPIYDAVFKYLLEDNRLAKLIISTIIGAEILELTLQPQEQITKLEARSLTVYRLDFAARIKDASGQERKVLIEIQKAKFDTDIMRFRRYLGSQYADPGNVRTTQDGNETYPLPLVTIYFLGHPLKHIQSPAIYVAREYYDLTTKEKINEKEEFIESLTHDSYVIQIPRLRQERQSEIEEMLQVFAQANISGINKHILEVNEAEIPKRYHPIIRRLRRAIAEQKVLLDMDVEDDILEELQNWERKTERMRLEKEQAVADKERALAEKEHALAEKERERAEKERALSEIAQEKAKTEQLLQLLKAAGIDPAHK